MTTGQDDGCYFIHFRPVDLTIKLGHTVMSGWSIIYIEGPHAMIF